MSPNTKALFIGRFQPFHIGHLDALTQISEDKIIIGIGSSQYSKTEENPWTFEERKQMIDHALAHENLNYQIIAIPDIHDEKNWVEHVEKIVGKFDLVYTGNDWVQKLFEEKGYVVKKIEIKIQISGTELRKMIREENGEWKKYVPKNTVNLIHNFEI